MALTKVSGDFIKAGSVTQAHLHSSHGITTSHIAEGDKLFFTNARVDSRIGSLSSSDLSEGTNLYYTDARARAAISATGSLSYNSTTGVMSFTMPAQNTSNITEGSNLYYTDARADARIAAASTSDLSEGTNLYYTDARADARITASDTDSLSEGSTNLYYTDARADARVALIVDSAPGTLNTLNELAAALGDDANFSTTVTNSIATKLPLAGGTLTGALTGTSFNDGYITWSAAQLNRYGAAIELQYTPTNAATLVKIGANGSNPTIFNAYTGDASFAGDVNTSGDVHIDEGSTTAHQTSNKLRFGNSGWNNNIGIESYWMKFGSNQNEGFKFEDSNSNMLLQLDGGNNTSGNGALSATFAGAITASGGNSTQWNTAYGWGNHASGGYAADNAVVKLTGNQSIDGIKTFIGTHLSLNTAANSWKYFRLQSGTSVLWDIATNENDDSSSLQFRPAGGPTNRVTISQAGVIAAPGASINASAGYPLQTSSSQRYNIQIRNTNNTVNASYGWWWGTDTNFDMFFHADGASDRFTLTRQGEATAFASMSAPIYYDRNDTSYYLNPASTSISLNVAGSIVAGTNPDTTPGGTAFSHTLSSVGGSSRVVNFEGASSSISTWYSVGNVPYAAIDQNSSYMSFYQNLGLGWQEQFRIYRGYQESLNNLRAPIFYDASDTAYYLDPASTGTSLNVRGEISNPSIWINDGDNTGNYNENIRLFDPAAGHPSVIAFGATGTSGSPATSILGYSDRLESRFADAWQLRVKSGYVQASGDFRAPIFYDSNDTSWYLNPASTSLLNRVEINDDLDVRAQVGTWITSDVMGDAIGWNSSYGVYIGSNVGGTHYLRGNGTFTTGGATHNLWHEGNDTTFVRYRSSLTSQDWNSYIDGTEAGYNSVLNHSGSNRPPAYTYGIALNLGVSGQGKAQLYFPETGSSSNGIYVRTGWSSSYRDWRSIALHNVNPQTGGALYASGFYDSGNTGFYINADSTSNLYNLELSGAKHTYLYITPGNGYEAMVRFNGGSGNTWYAGKRTSTQLLGSTDAFHFYSQTSGQTVGGYDTGGHHYTVGSSRGPIFYDQNDTSYYTDPNSTSRINALTTNSLQVGSATIGLVVTPSWTNANADQWPYITWHRDTANSWDEGLIKNSSSRGFFGKGGWGIHMDSTRAFHVFSSGWTSNFGVEHGGSCRAAGDLRAPVFYDLNNTAYYTDPASTSIFNALQFAYTVHGGANNIRMGNSTTMNAISSGSNNAAFGVEALGGCSTGSRNFAYGYAALYNLSSGGNNIAMGDATGYNVTSGSNNLLFGQNAGRTGYQSPQSIAGITSGSNQIHMGNESHSTARIQISWTVNSDSRDKTDVTPIDVGLDFVKDLNPVTFRWDKRSDYEDRTPTGENKLEELTLGFLAQEVEAVEKSYGYDVANKTNLVVDRDVENDGFGLTYEKMIPILTKAIQEQQTIIDDLKSRIETLENN